MRLSSDEPKPAVGQNPEAEKYVEFMKGGKVAGREVATVIGAEDIGKIAKGKKPHANSSSVETLKGGDFVRVVDQQGRHQLPDQHAAAGQRQGLKALVTPPSHRTARDADGRPA